MGEVEKYLKWLFAWVFLVTITFVVNHVLGFEIAVLMVLLFILRAVQD